MPGARATCPWKAATAAAAPPAHPVLSEILESKPGASSKRERPQPRQPATSAWLLLKKRPSEAETPP